MMNKFKLDFMNKLVYIMLLVVGFSACREERVPVYLDEDRINFVGTSEDNEDDPDFLFAEKNFLAESGEVSVLTLRVKVQGKPSDTDRKVFFIDRDSTDPGLELSFGECIVPAGKLKGECRIEIARLSGEEEWISLVAIDYERSDFKRGTYERQEFMIKAFNQINYDILGIYEGFWEDNFMDWELGPWSFAKATFICRTLGITNFSNWYNDPAHWLIDWDTGTIMCHDKQTLKEALEAYKANPVNPPLYDETMLPEEVWISFEGYL